MNSKKIKGRFYLTFLPTYYASINVKRLMDIFFGKSEKL